MTDIHSCSYFCDRPECIKAQRDELRDRLAQPEQESFSPEAISVTQAAWKMGYDAAKAEQPEQGGKTGWPAGMLQDDSRELSKALASKPDAKQHAREAAHGIKENT